VLLVLVTVFVCLVVGLFSIKLSQPLAEPSIVCSPTNGVSLTAERRKT
jgi:hypothetical protein